MISDLFRVSQHFSNLSLFHRLLRSQHLVISPPGKQIGEKMEAVTDFIFLGSKITVDGDCSHEIRRLLFLGRKTMKNLEVYLIAETSLGQQISV